MPSPSRLPYYRNITDGTDATNRTDGTMDECIHDSSDYTIDSLDLDALGSNAFIPHTALHASGPPSRPLEFPAPIVDRAVTESADIMDHRTKKVFRASSVLMRRAVHAKTCASRASPSASSVSGGASFDGSRANGRHCRMNSRDGIHNWHSSVNALSISSLNSDSPRKQPQQQHRRTHSHASAKQQIPCTPIPCTADCNLPDKAYCVTRKICNTTYGSVRICVVLKRVDHGVIRSHGDTLSSRENGLCEQATATWETTDEMVVIKVANWSKLQSLRGCHLEDPVKEIAALQQLLGNYHPNVISILDSLQSETHLYCVFPYIKGGDLYGCVLDNMTSSPTGRLDESQARAWFRQILCAINHLQKKGVCHRDLCLENMMVDEDNNIHVIDFGLVLRVPFSDQSNRNLVSDVSANTSRRLMKAQGQCGKWAYMAPEVCMRHDTFDGFAIDLWAAGVVLFEFLVGKKPFQMPDPVDQNFHTIAVQGDLAGILQTKGIELNDKAVDLLQSMLYYDPAKRLTLSEIVDHPWVRGDRKQVAPRVNQDGAQKMWFLRSKSIDDMNHVKSVNDLMLAELSDYTTSYTVESMASTVDTSDAESQMASTADISAAESRNLPMQSSSDYSMSHSSQEKPLPVEAEIDKLENTGRQKKRSWFKSLKLTHWMCADNKILDR